MILEITSNATGLRQRMERFLTRFPEAQRATMNPARSWLPVAKRHATMALEMVAAPQERPMIATVVSTVMVEYLGYSQATGASMEWTVGNVARALSVAEAIAGAGGLGPLFQTSTREELKELLRAWVRTPEEQGGKRRDERDVDKTDEEIVHRILRVLDRGRASEFDAAKATGLARHIEAFSRVRGALSGFDPALLDKWLKVILQAWTALLLSQVGPLFQREIRRIWSETRV